MNSEIITISYVRFISAKEEHWIPARRLLITRRICLFNLKQEITNIINNNKNMREISGRDSYPSRPWRIAFNFGKYPIADSINANVFRRHPLCKQMGRGEIRWGSSSSEWHRIDGTARRGWQMN